MPLLVTKLFIPQVRAELVTRPRLIERLNAGLHRKLTLVSAPAGFGKTTLVSEWISTLRSSGTASAHGVAGAAWLSLDESDNDPTRFLAYFIAALQTVEATMGNEALCALRSAQPPPVEAILTLLINEIASLPSKLVLVLDDFHLIESQSIHGILTFLIEHLPPQMHLVFSTRDDPQIPLNRLRARGHLTELRATDLRFSSSEAAEFLNQVMGLGLSTEDVAALETRTEGWIAGLQLAALSMQEREDVSILVRSFAGSHRLVLDYLIEEVLEQQSDSTCTFLLQTAVLNRLTGALCDVLTGQDNGRATLEMLERANLFIIPLDEERHWYRYHHLFADLLRQRLNQTQSELAPRLHHRASEWYEQNGFFEEATEHALRAENLERVAYLIEQHVDAMWERGEHTRLRNWMAGLPEDLIFTKPHLCILRAWDMFTSGRLDMAERTLQAAEQWLAGNSDPVATTSQTESGHLTDSDRESFHGRAAAIRAFLASYRGDLPGTIEFARRALERLPEQDSSWRNSAAIALGDAYSLGGELSDALPARLQALEASKPGGNIHLIGSLKLADTRRQLGQLHRTIAICRRQVELAQRIGMSQTMAAGWLLSLWGETLAELNELDGALDKAKEGARITERGADVTVLGWSWLHLTRVLFSRGELAGAETIVEKMAGVAQKHDVPPFITGSMAAWQARIWLAQDKLSSAFQWEEERGLDAVEGPTLLREIEYMALARILIAQGRPGETTRLLQRLLEPAEAGGHTSRVIELLLLQALAFQAGGHAPQAMTALGRALDLAEPGGFIRTFVDEGPPMAHLLYEAVARDIAPEYARRLLSAFPVDEPAQSAPATASDSESGLIEPLSERELEVLQLVAEGLTNQEIAARLFLALSTVKSHTRSIYGKLDVRSRTQAVARARAFGILPSG